MDSERSESRAAPAGGGYNQNWNAPSDSERVAALQLEASCGAVDGLGWRAIRDDVWPYAIRVLRAMIRDGEIWKYYKRLGGRTAQDLALPLHGVHAEAAHDLATDVSSGSLGALRDQLLAGRWDSTRGASLRTWFVNLCILRFPPVWRAWLADGRNQPVPVEVVPESATDPEDRPDAVVYELEFERYVGLLDDDVQEIVRLDARGMTDAEIAEAVERSKKSVEYQLAKARRSSRARREREKARDRANGAA